MPLTTHSDHFDVRDSLGYLVHVVRQEWIDALEQELAPLDLTAAQYKVIILVGSGRASTPMDLCHVLEYDTGAMTRLIDRVEAKGLVKRVAHGADRRSVTVELTAAGHDLYPRLVEIVKEMHQRALHGLTRAEVEELERLLLRVKANMAATRAIPARKAKGER
jgi:DNA-binding MarR family transcriptional regulator